MPRPGHPPVARCPGPPSGSSAIPIASPPAGGSASGRSRVRRGFGADPVENSTGLVDIQTEVHQANGMVAVGLGVGLPEALVRIRGHAFARGRTLAEAEEDIVERRVRPDSGERP